jgi:hypothetical protein
MKDRSAVWSAPRSSITMLGIGFYLCHLRRAVIAEFASDLMECRT